MWKRLKVNLKQLFNHPHRVNHHSDEYLDANLKRVHKFVNSHIDLHEDDEVTHTQFFGENLKRVKTTLYDNN